MNAGRRRGRTGLLVEAGAGRGFGKRRSGGRGRRRPTELPHEGALLRPDDADAPAERLATPWPVMHSPSARAAAPHLPFCLLGAVGLVTFPLAGAALLARLVEQTGFVVLSSLALVLLVAAVLGLETSFADRSGPSRPAS